MILPLLLLLIIITWLLLRDLRNKHHSDMYRDYKAATQTFVADRGHLGY